MSPEAAEHSGELIRQQLKERNQIYNRNIFTVRTDDEEAQALRRKCDQLGIKPNKFIRSLIRKNLNGWF